jgi:hypothetical protein
MGLNMKKLYLVISIVVILAIVCSPAIAISKSDLIASYKGQSSPTILTPIPTSTPTPTVTPPTLDINDRFRMMYGYPLVPGPPFPSLESLSEFYGGEEWWMKGRPFPPVSCCASGNHVPTSLYETRSFNDNDSGVSIGVPDWSNPDYSVVFA